MQALAEREGTMATKREQIVTEIERRLALAFPDSKIERGFQDESVTSYDHFYILDLPEQFTNLSRGAYEVELPVSLSYWIQADRKEIHSIGNELLDKIRLALELDENFGRLVLSYKVDEGALIWYDEGVMDVELMFTFRYTKDAGWVQKPFKP